LDTSHMTVVALFFMSASGGFWSRTRSSIKDAITSTNTQQAVQLCRSFASCLRLLLTSSNSRLGRVISGAKLAAVTVRAREDVAAAGAAVVGAGAAVPAAREDRGEAEVLPERPQADVPQGPLRRHHLRRHPARPRRLQHVPRRTCPAHPARISTTSLLKHLC